MCALVENIIKTPEYYMIGKIREAANRFIQIWTTSCFSCIRPSYVNNNQHKQLNSSSIRLEFQQSPNLQRLDTTRRTYHSKQIRTNGPNGLPLLQNQLDRHPRIRTNLERPLPSPSTRLCRKHDRTIPAKNIQNIARRAKRSRS